MYCLYVPCTMYCTMYNRTIHVLYYIPNLHRNNTDKPANSVHVPVVLVLVEGGPNSLLQTLDAVRREIPVVVVDKSGRVADVLAFAIRITRPKHSKSVAPSIRKNT